MHGHLLQVLLLVAATANARLIKTDVKALDQNAATIDCYWSGTSPFCAGSCDTGYAVCGASGCGDSACCIAGYKKYCCKNGCPEAMLDLEGAPPKIPNDDYCPPGKHILCPPEAKRNEECFCFDNDALGGLYQGRLGL